MSATRTADLTIFLSLVLCASVVNSDFSNLADRPISRLETDTNRLSGRAIAAIMRSQPDSLLPRPSSQEPTHATFWSNGSLANRRLVVGDVAACCQFERLNFTLRR